MILFLILFVCCNLNSITRADDVNDYINALPSEERYAYMKNVARRIVYEVEAKETPNATSFEIPDAMVAKSNEYVNKVMKEELTKIKTARKNNKNRRPAQNVTKPEDRKAKYINFTFRTDLHDDMRDHIDLTVAERRKSIDPANAEPASEGSSKKVKKREVSEVPVKVIFDQPKGSKRNERRSWDRDDDDDYDRRDDNSKSVEEKSIEKEVKENIDDVINLNETSSNKNNNDDNAKSIEPTDSKQSELYRKDPPDSPEENKMVTERLKSSKGDAKLLETAISFSPPVTNGKINDWGRISKSESPFTETGRPGIDDTTFLVHHKDDATFPTTELFIDTKSGQPPTASIESAVPIALETEKPVLRVLGLDVDNNTSTSEEHKSTDTPAFETRDPISVTQEQRTASSTQEAKSTQELENRETTTQEAKSSLANTIELKSEVSSTLEPESTISTTLEPKSTVSTTLEPESTVSTVQSTISTVSSTQEGTSATLLHQETDDTVPTVQETKQTQLKQSLRTGVVSEEAEGKNIVYRADQLILRDGGQTTDGPLHFETLFRAEPKPTKKVRIQELTEEKVVPSKSHQHGILYYRVFEVDPALDPFKLRSEGTGNQEQPYYAPVYNYEPESAFLGTQDRQGPILKTDGDDDLTNLRQTVSKELRTKLNQEYYVPVYNYEPSNAYYNPQNRLGPNADNADDLFYKRAGVKADPTMGKGKVDEDYYYARNEAIEDSVESRKFRFRGIPGVLGELGKSPFIKPQPLSQNGLLVNQFIYASTHQPKNQNRHQLNIDYNDYYYGRKDGLRHDDQKPKNPQLDEIYVQLDKYFAKKKKASLTNMRKLKKQPNLYETKDDTKRKEHKPSDDKPVSLDYYFGVHDQGAMLYKLKYNQNSLLGTEKPTRDGYRHRARENNAIDLDYYFDRKESNEGQNIDEDFPDYVDKENLGADDVVSRKSRKHKDVRNKDVKQKDLLKPYTRVLKDMFEIKSGVLLNYDWLGTTVNIRSAVAKLLDMMDAEEHGEKVNAKDKEVMKYLVAAHSEAMKGTGEDAKELSACVATKFPKLVVEALRYKHKQKQVLPKNRNRKPGQRIKNPLKLMRDVYTRLMRSCGDDEEIRAAQRDQEFKRFLLDLEEGLYDFHMAIKLIASVTKYDKQNWYQNIKDLYLSGTRSKSKELLEVLAHLVVMEVFERIEESAKEGLEQNSAKYREQHPEEFKQTKNELTFVLRLLQEIKKYD